MASPLFERMTRKPPAAGLPTNDYDTSRLAEAVNKGFWHFEPRENEQRRKPREVDASHPPERMSLEPAIAYIHDNELVEATPRAVRIQAVPRSLSGRDKADISYRAQPFSELTAAWR